MSLPRPLSKRAEDYNEISNNPKSAVSHAQQVLAKAKALEQKRIKQGYKWVKCERGMMLVKPE